MTIVVTGGGSGGHITPILAVANDIKKLAPETRIIYIGQKGENLLDIAADNPSIDEVHTVRAGKFRRYHGEGWKQLLDLTTQAKNLRDAVFVAIGLWQSFWLLRKLKPSIIFTRGGFVSVPVGLGAVLNRIPYVTHDSDSVPSLANRIIARWARWHTVALPKDLYAYPATKTVTVGIPLATEFQPVTSARQQAYRKQLKLDAYQQVVLVTGGGNGAEQLNDAVLANAHLLLKSFPDLVLIHLAGRSLETAVSKAYDTLLEASDRSRVKVLGFVTDFYRYSGAADVIVSRAGATTLAAFAAQGKACIIVPAGHLVADHQTKNAQALAQDKAIIMLTQDQADQDQRLARTIADLLSNGGERQRLASSLARFARLDAAHTLAMLLLDEAKPTKTKQ